mgnify:CR=1 FL=1
MAHDGTEARRSAVWLLGQVLGEGRLLSDLLASGGLDRLEPADRARAQRLATDTLRTLSRADALLKPFLRKPPPLEIFNILRVGTVELCQGGAAHGVLSAMVEVAGKGRKTQHLKGLVNAVLRKVAADGPAKWDSLPVPKLRNWLRGPLVEAYGRKTVEAMEAAHLRGAPLDLTPRTAPDVWARRLGADLLPSGSLRLTDPGQITAMPGYDEGAWWVQDAAAAMAVRILDPQPGETVLDLCAAPGGKTMQLAAAGASVTALDLSEPRMERVRANLMRIGLAAEILVADALGFQGGPYDAILLDAPCSATGTIRRHPDLPHARDGAEIGGLIALQARMIDHALTLLKPGGRLVFCTCSLLPDEGECQAEDALGRHPDLSIDRAVLDRPGIDPAWITEEGGLRLRPDYWAERGGMDGFYIACLHKAS